MLEKGAHVRAERHRKLKPAVFLVACLDADLDAADRAPLSAIECHDGASF